MTHLYVVVNCKTEHCQTAHVLKYLGGKGEVGEIPMNVPCPLLIECPQCRQTHDYHDPQHFRQVEKTSAPQFGHSNRI